MDRVTFAAGSVFDVDLEIQGDSLHILHLELLSQLYLGRIQRGNVVGSDEEVDNVDG